jgi:hypothetical protein
MCVSSIVRWAEVGLDRRGDAPAPRRALVAAAGAVSVLALALVGVGYRGYPASSAAQLDVVVERARGVAELDGTDNGVLVLLEEPEGSAIATDEFAMLLLAPTFVAELRLLGIDARFPPGPFDARYGPVSAYQYERPAEGDESLVVLFRAGAGVGADPPEGFALLSADGVGVGSSDPAPAVASAVFVATG